MRVYTIVRVRGKANIQLKTECKEKRKKKTNETGKKLMENSKSMLHNFNPFDRFKRHSRNRNVWKINWIWMTQMSTHYATDRSEYVNSTLQLEKRW